jgi:hypothetical protein
MDFSVYRDDVQHIIIDNLQVAQSKLFIVDCDPLSFVVYVASRSIS